MTNYQWIVVSMVLPKSENITILTKERIHFVVVKNYTVAKHKGPAYKPNV